jgi:nucleotide-binding universal stress UspA family protein
VQPQKRALANEANAPFSSIVCPIDFSPASLSALPKAVAIARQSGGQLTLLHVLVNFPNEAAHSGTRAFGAIDQYRFRVERVNRRLRSLVSSEALGEAEIVAETMSGAAHNAILDAARERRADLIVMGQPPRRWFEDLVLGSTVKKVVDRAQCAVLLVPPAPAAVSREDGSVIADRERGHSERFSS